MAGNQNVHFMWLLRTENRQIISTQCTHPVYAVLCNEWAIGHYRNIRVLANLAKSLSEQTYNERIHRCVLPCAACGNPPVRLLDEIMFFLGRAQYPQQPLVLIPSVQICGNPECLRRMRGHTLQLDIRWTGPYSGQFLPRQYMSLIGPAWV